MAKRTLFNPLIGKRFQKIDEPNSSVFADETTVAPAIPGKPTEAEIATFVTGLTGTQTDIIIYYTGTDTDTDKTLLAFYVDKDGLTKVLSSTDIKATGVDSNAGAYTETLDAATGSGSVKFWVNEDLTNPATLSVQAGEFLNGVEDGTFSFSTYPVGTQFIATDTATGQWNIAVQGASTGISLDRGLFRLSTDFSNSAGNNVWQQIPFDVVSYDTGTAFDIPTNSYVTPSSGDYHTDLLISYQNNGGSSNDPMTVAIRVNGVTALSVWHDISDQISSNGGIPITISGILPNLSQGDVITAEIFDADDIIIHRFENTSWSITKLPSEESVLAGMVPVTTLSRIQVSLSVTKNDAVATHYSFDQEVFNQGSDLTLSGTGSIQGLKAGKTYRVTFNGAVDPPFAGFGAFRFVDLTANTQFGETFELISQAHPVPEGTQSSQIAFFTPTVDSEVGFDWVGGTVGEVGAGCTFTVEEVPTSSIIQLDGFNELVYQSSFLSGDWVGAGPITLSIPQSTHGLGYFAGQMFSVDVYDVVGNMLGIDVNVNITNGDVTVTSTGAAFDGIIKISI